jgi:hypothetical protein
MPLVDRYTFCQYAICSQDYAALEWALNNNYLAYNSKFCALAAERGSFDLLRWLHQHGMPWDVETCRAAIRKNHFQILKWAVQRGCRTGKDLHLYAQTENKPLIARWLWEYRRSPAYTKVPVKYKTRPHIS